MLFWAGSAFAQVPMSPQEAEPDEPRIELEAPADTVIERRITAVMQEITAFNDVSVEVRSGVARLSGVVATAQHREDARELARRFEGILWVDNQISVAADVETRILPALDRIERAGRQLLSLLPVIVLVLLLVAILWALGSLIQRWEAPVERFGFNPLIWGLVRRMARMLLVLFGLILVFDLLGIATMVGALLGTAGVVGLVLGFAFREIAENYLAGILLSIRQPFSIGDLVQIDQHEGHVLRLTSRELILLSFEGNHVRLPNSTVFKSIIVNFTQNPRRRIEFAVGVDPSTPLRKAAELAKNVVAELPGIIPDPPPFARVMELGDSAIELRVFGWIDQRETDFLKVRSEAVRAVKIAFDDAGIQMPDPQLGVTIKREERQKATSKREQPAADEDVRSDGKLEAQLREELERDDENLLKG
jgi:small conductance mechanosensitive channel